MPLLLRTVRLTGRSYVVSVGLPLWMLRQRDARANRAASP